MYKPPLWNSWAEPWTKVTNLKYGKKALSYNLVEMAE